MQVVAAVPANLFQRVGFDQKLAANLPLDLPFRDSQGRWVHLNDYFGRRPVLLVLGYYQCPNLCDQVWRGLLESLQRLELDVGRDFELLAVSIDPQEGPELARSKRAAYLDAYVRPGTQAGWHFLTGEEKSIRHLADAVGFRYVYDPERDQYAHAAGLVVSTPDGHIPAASAIGSDKKVHLGAAIHIGCQRATAADLDVVRMRRQGQNSVHRLTPPILRITRAASGPTLNSKSSTLR